MKRIFYDTTNVSRFIYKSDNDREHFITQPSLRNIELIRDNGTRRNVDIYKYYMTNDDKYNPTLLDGDMIKIPNVLLQNNYITVTGAVQLGGTYEWAPGDNLETLIGLGRGFDMHAEPDSILLYSLTAKQRILKYLNFRMSGIKILKSNLTTGLLLSLNQITKRKLPYLYWVKCKGRGIIRFHLKLQGLRT